MGAKPSKRSVDISGKEAESGGEVAAAGGGAEGRVEALADADALKPQVNGDAHIHENTEKEKQLDSGTPENEKDATTEKEEKEQQNGNDAEKEGMSVTNGEAEPKEGGDTSQTPDDGKKPKKEKVKKKWSLRSISFSRKDKPKQEKKQKEEEAKTNGEHEKVPEEAAEATPETSKTESVGEAKADAEPKEEKTPETPVTEPLTNGSSTPESKAETPATEEAAPVPLPTAEPAPQSPTEPEPQSTAEPEPQPAPARAESEPPALNGLSLHETKDEPAAETIVEESRSEKPELTAETETTLAPEIPVVKEVCVEKVSSESLPPPLPANPPPSSVVSFAASTMAPELMDASLANSSEILAASHSIPSTETPNHISVSAPILGLNVVGHDNVTEQSYTSKDTIDKVPAESSSLVTEDTLKTTDEFSQATDKEQEDIKETHIYTFNLDNTESTSKISGNKNSDLFKEDISKDHGNQTQIYPEMVQKLENLISAEEHMSIIPKSLEAQKNTVDEVILITKNIENVKVECVKSENVAIYLDNKLKNDSIVEDIKNEDIVDNNDQSNISVEVNELENFENKSAHISETVINEVNHKTDKSKIAVENNDVEKFEDKPAYVSERLISEVNHKTDSSKIAVEINVEKIEDKSANMSETEINEVNRKIEKSKIAGEVNDVEKFEDKSSEIVVNEVNHKTDNSTVTEEVNDVEKFEDNSSCMSETVINDVNHKIEELTIAEVNDVDKFGDKCARMSETVINKGNQSENECKVESKKEDTADAANNSKTSILTLTQETLDVTKNELKQSDINLSTESHVVPEVATDDLKCFEADMTTDSQDVSESTDDLPPPPPPLDDEIPDQTDTDSEQINYCLEVPEPIVEPYELLEPMTLSSNCQIQSVISISEVSESDIIHEGACNGEAMQNGEKLERVALEDSAVAKLGAELSAPAAGLDPAIAAPQEIAVSDKLAELIPEVPVIPDLNTETLTETTTDVAVNN